MYNSGVINHPQASRDLLEQSNTMIISPHNTQHSYQSLCLAQNANGCGRIDSIEGEGDNFSTYNKLH